MIDKFFDRIFWLNTKARRDRAANMAQRLEKYSNTERFEAIAGGTEIALRIIKKDGLFAPQNRRRILNLGEIGCFISHREIWKYAKEKGYSKVLILEDDAEIQEDANAVFSEAIESLPDNWDMLYLGQRNYDNLKNSREKDGDMAALTGHVSGSLYEAKRCWLTHAYAINIKCVDYLLEHTKQIDWPIDGVLADVQKELNVYAFYPSLVVQDATKSSLR